MQAIHAVYKLAEIRRLRGSTLSSQRVGGAATTATRISPQASYPETVGAQTAQQLSTLREMLYSHFAEEVRQRDRDGDGSLSRREYGGEPETFTHIDTDRDGLVDASDLMRVALDRNPELSWMVAGPWAPIYDRVLSLENPDEDHLRAVVADGVRQAYERDHVMENVRVDHAARSGPSPIPIASVDSAAAPAQEEEILGAFLRHHKDLLSLHERLQNLADRLGRYRPYCRIDLIA